MSHMFKHALTSVFRQYNDHVYIIVAAILLSFISFATFVPVTAIGFAVIVAVFGIKGTLRPALFGFISIAVGWIVIHMLPLPEWNEVSSTKGIIGSVSFPIFSLNNILLSPDWPVILHITAALALLVPGLIVSKARLAGSTLAILSLVSDGMTGASFALIFAVFMLSRGWVGFMSGIVFGSFGLLARWPAEVMGRDLAIDRVNACLGVEWPCGSESLVDLVTQRVLASVTTWSLDVAMAASFTGAAFAALAISSLITHLHGGKHSDRVDLIPSYIASSLKQWSTRLWVLIQILIVLYVMVGAVGRYHPAVPAIASHLGAIAMMQGLILAIWVMVHQRSMLLALYLSGPFALLLYAGGALGDLTRWLHLIVDGPWEGVSSQDVAFDKQLTFVLFYTIALVALCTVAQSKRGFGKSIASIMFVCVTAATVGYHNTAILGAWGHISELRGQVTGELKLADNRESDCDTLNSQEAVCYALDAGDPMPRDRIFQGNPDIQKAGQEFQSGSKFFGSSSLSMSSIDDTYMQSFMASGLFEINSDGSARILYSRAESIPVQVLSNIVGIMVWTGAMFWQLVWVSLIPAHSRAGRLNQEHQEPCKFKSSNILYLRKHIACIVYFTWFLVLASCWIAAGAVWCNHNMVFSSAVSILMAPVVARPASLFGGNVDLNPVTLCIVSLMLILSLNIFSEPFLPDSWLHTSHIAHHMSTVMPLVWATSLLGIAMLAFSLSKRIKIFLLLGALLSGAAPYLVSSPDYSEAAHTEFDQISILDKNGKIIDQDHMIEKFDFNSIMTGLELLMDTGDSGFFYLYMIDIGDDRLSKLVNNEFGGVDLLIYDYSEEDALKSSEGFWVHASTALGGVFSAYALMLMLGLGFTGRVRIR